MAYWGFGEELGKLIYHDLSGWLMMPVALGMLWVVLKLIDAIWVPIQSEREVPDRQSPGFLLRPKAPVT